jgi:hypothetical protein
MEDELRTEELDSLELTDELDDTCTVLDVAPPVSYEEDESPSPFMGGSVCGSGLLQVIRKNTRATIAGRTPRFTILFINTPRRQYGLYI